MKIVPGCLFLVSAKKFKSLQKHYACFFIQNYYNRNNNLFCKAFLLKKKQWEEILKNLSFNCLLLGTQTAQPLVRFLHKCPVKVLSR